VKPKTGIVVEPLTDEYNRPRCDSYEMFNEPHKNLQQPSEWSTNTLALLLHRGPTFCNLYVHGFSTMGHWLLVTHIYMFCGQRITKQINGNVRMTFILSPRSTFQPLLFYLNLLFFQVGVYTFLIVRPRYLLYKIIGFSWSSSTFYV
jgi:hypothetical protein